MNNKLIKALLPINKNGDLDERFKESIQRVLKDIGFDTANVLSDFYVKTAELQRSASRAGLELAIALSKESHRLSTHEYRHPDDEYNWMSKSLKKQTSEILNRLGFKEKNTSKILRAAEFKQSFKIYTDWIDSLSVSHLNELSRMNEEGIKKVIKEVSTDKTTFLGSEETFLLPAKEWKDISVRRFEDIRRFNPKNLNLDNPLSGLEVSSSEDSAIDVEALEVLEVNQQSIAKDIVSLAKQLNHEAWKDQEIISILKEAQSELWNIAHIAAQPTKELTPN
jgi:Holliday junction resolvasome RuvABC DNA-binding subunit